MADEFGRHLNKVWKVTAWRETIATTPWRFDTKRLAPGEQLEITEQRVRFKVERSFKKHPNACDIYVYNLAEDTRADLETRPLQVQIEAGYEESGGARLVYSGDLRFGMSDQSSETTETLLQLGEKDRAHAHSRTNKAYRAGTTYRRIIHEIAASMGLTLPGNLASDPALDRVVAEGDLTRGPSREELTRLLAPFGYHWSVQHGVLRVLRDEEVNSQDALPIDEAHGMVGTPSYGSPPRSGKPPHMNVKMLLYPELAPGDLVMLTSKVKTGLFRLERVRHNFDSHVDSASLTECEIRPY